MEIKVKLGMGGLFLSALLFTAVLVEGLAASSRFTYIAAISVLPFIYGITHGNRSTLLIFPILLGFSYVPTTASYSLTVPSILKLSIIWSFLFVLFAILSVPESKEIEKRALITGIMASSVSSFSVIGIFLMISPILNPFIVIAMGVMAAAAMLYVSHSEG